MLLIPAHRVTAESGSGVLSTGDIFPNLTFNKKPDTHSATYLDTGMQSAFSFREISGSFFVIEVFNVLCRRCPKNVPLLNALYASLEKNPHLKDRIKVIGIAAGNSRRELNIYTRQYNLSFPAFADEHFSAYMALGKPQMPYTLFVKRNRAGEDIVVSAHQGMFNPSTVLLDIVSSLFMDTL